MGIFIHLAVSKSVTQKEWTEVYEESLKMADALGLSDFRSVSVRGVEVACLTKTREREFSSWLETGFTGWCADGVYSFRNVCESNTLRRNIRYIPNQDAGDPVLSLYREEDSDYKLYWDGKTQGEPQHLCLLSIGCMMEDMLKDRAFVFGDISRGQCRHAAEMAGKALGRPVPEPDRCDMTRFFERISKLQTDEKVKLSIFQMYCLEERNAAYGEFLRKHFSAEMLKEYWQKRCADMPADRIGYSEIYKEYLTEGFDLGELCRITVLKDREGKDLSAKFVRKVLESELYIPKKDVEDVLELNTDAPQPYSIYSLFVQFVFAGARNPRIDRYISLEEIRKTLNEELGGICDVNGIIDQYFSEKKPAADNNSDGFTSMTRQLAGEQQKKREKYDVSSYEMLSAYCRGDTIEETILCNTVRFHEFCRDMLRQYPDEAAEFAKKDPGEKFRELAERSSDLELQDRDWEKIFSDIEEHPDSCARYWSAAKVSITSENVRRIVQAYCINDDLYLDLEKGMLRIPGDQ